MKRSALMSSLVVVAALAAAPAAGSKKHKGDQEQVTQALELPKELPQATVADADRVVFAVTPLRGDGLLSQQLREALHGLLRQDRPLVKLRVFVAGSGDTRRVQTVVSELCTEKRAALPALTVVQVGELPREGAQVVVESITLDRKPVNPNGIAFVPAESEYVNQPLQPVLPRLRRVLDRLRAALAAKGTGPGDVLSLTCYPTSLEEASAFREAAAGMYPNAALDFVQPLRAALDSGVTCEATGRIAAPQAASGPAQLVFTGAQLAFGTAAPDARLGFERLGKTLTQAGASYSGVAHAGVYSLSRSAGELAERTGRELFDSSKPPALTVLPVEGLPSLDASFAVDVVAVLPSSK
jgi:enamine deaminase RidA (YjgF/YER057c/UK114 family)